MDQMLEVFITEARDNLQAAGACFLELEKTPKDSDLMDDLFRSIHTIKGSSGLFDMPAFTSTVHAAEDVLDNVRSSEINLSSEIIDLLLDSMDQISAWLDELEQAGELGADASEHSKRYTQQLRALLNEEEQPPSVSKKDVCQVEDEAPSEMGSDLRWPKVLEVSARASVTKLNEESNLIAIRYMPESNCFFAGDDPLHSIRNMPGLQWFDVKESEPWPEPVDLDPYHANLIFYAVSDADAQTLDQYFRYVTDQITRTPFSWQLFEAVEAADTRTGDAQSRVETNSETILVNLPSEQVSAVFNLLNAQQSLLRVERDLDQAERSDWGGIPSVARVVVNLLSVMDLPQDDFNKMAQEAQEAGDGELLLEYLEQLKVRITQAGLIGQPANASEAPQKAAGRGVKEVSMPSTQFEPVVESVNVERKDAALNTKPKETAATLEEKPVSAKPAISSKTLKVDQARIDTIMDLVGELVVAKNALPFLARQAEEKYGIKSLGKEIKAQYAVINRLSQELQGAIMQVRMVPISHVFQRFPRLVRDLSRKLNKKIRLNLEGEETEADKNVVENLADPLIHLVRNSLDHGLESPEERTALGKPQEGQLTLRAISHEDQVVIEVIDDGRGIDPEKIKQKAYEKQIIDENRLDSISDVEALQLIFAAGFSTKEEVSDLSGRGVGMDVVRTVINEAGGSVKVLSDKGKGSTLRLTLPLSMAVTRVMMIDVNHQSYGISMEHVVETVRVPASSFTLIKRREVVVLRSRLIPIFYLRDLMNLPRQEKSDDEEIAVLVMKMLGEEVGLVIDEFLEGVDILLKPLDGVMADFPIYSGAALLGNGRVLLVLNVQEFIKCQSIT